MCVPVSVTLSEATYEEYHMSGYQDWGTHFLSQSTNTLFSRRRDRLHLALDIAKNVKLTYLALTRVG